MPPEIEAPENGAPNEAPAHDAGDGSIGQLLGEYGLAPDDAALLNGAAEEAVAEHEPAAAEGEQPGDEQTEEAPATTETETAEAFDESTLPEAIRNELAELRTLRPAAEATPPNGEQTQEQAAENEDEFALFEDEADFDNYLSNPEKHAEKIQAAMHFTAKATAKQVIDHVGKELAAVEDRINQRILLGALESAFPDYAEKSPAILLAGLNDTAKANPKLSGWALINAAKAHIEREAKRAPGIKAGVDKKVDLSGGGRFRPTVPGARPARGADNSAKDEVAEIEQFGRANRLNS